MNRLPEPPARQPNPDTLHHAAQIAAAVDAIYEQPTHYRDNTLPATYTIGTTPPVPQPGKPPMSQRATDASGLILSVGVASVPVGGMASLLVYTLGHVDPTTLAIAAAAPAAIALPILALCRLAYRTRQVVEAAPAVHHHHYAGPVQQQQTSINNRGIWAKTNYKQ